MKKFNRVSRLHLEWDSPKLKLYILVFNCYFSNENYASRENCVIVELGILTLDYEIFGFQSKKNLKFGSYKLTMLLMRLLQFFYILIN